MPQEFSALIRLLSNVVDQVGLDDTQHGKRVAYMASTCAELLNLPSFSGEEIFTVGLLHDIGVSSSQDHELLVTELNWDHAQAHCIEGASRIQNLPVLNRFSNILRYHHTLWSDLEFNTELTNDEKLVANLIFLVDRADALLFQYLQRHPGDEPMHAQAFICDSLRALNGYFAADLMSAFLQMAAIDAFWFRLEPNHLKSFVDEFTFSAELEFSAALEQQLGQLLATLIDAKSPYTAEHSIRVANLAMFLGKELGLETSRCEQLQTAGLVHDIGKLHVPDDVLEKPATLDSYELVSMRRHSFEAKEILKHFTPFCEIAEWVCQHHELLDGSGYPWQLKGDQILTESRIITIADIFQALLQDRPYRHPMTLEGVIEVMTSLVRAGKLDSDIFQLILSNQEHCYQLATCRPN